MVINYQIFRWSLIAGRLPGRTDNEVKNYWNSHLRRKLINMGIDPNNHRLNHYLPRPPAPCTAATATSSCLNNHASPPVKSVGDHDQTSDGGSSLDDNRCVLPDLNLDLDLAITISNPSLDVTEEEKKHKDSKHGQKF